MLSWSVFSSCLIGVFTFFWFFFFFYSHLLVLIALMIHSILNSSHVHLTAVESLSTLMIRFYQLYLDLLHFCTHWQWRRGRRQLNKNLLCEFVCDTESWLSVTLSLTACVSVISSFCFFCACNWTQSWPQWTVKVSSPCSTQSITSRCAEEELENISLWLIHWGESSCTEVLQSASANHLTVL